MYINTCIYIQIYIHTHIPYIHILYVHTHICVQIYVCLRAGDQSTFACFEREEVEYMLIILCCSLLLVCCLFWSFFIYLLYAYTLEVCILVVVWKPLQSFFQKFSKKEWTVGTCLGQDLLLSSYCLLLILRNKHLLCFYLCFHILPLQALDPVKVFWQDFLLFTWRIRLHPCHIFVFLHSFCLAHTNHVIILIQTPQVLVQFSFNF